MTRPRGFAWCRYTDDLGSEWALQVDADNMLDAARGWQQLEVGALPPLPRGWSPRRVKGLDPFGHTRYARLPSTFVDLWTGAASVFLLQASDGTFQPCTVIERQREIRRP